MKSQNGRKSDGQDSAALTGQITGNTAHSWNGSATESRYIQRVSLTLRSDGARDELSMMIDGTPIVVPLNDDQVWLLAEQFMLAVMRRRKSI